MKFLDNSSSKVDFPTIKMSVGNLVDHMLSKCLFTVIIPLKEKERCASLMSNRTFGENIFIYAHELFEHVRAHIVVRE